MNSSSDLRALDEADPDRNQSARDQHPVLSRPEGEPFTPLSYRPPVISTKSVYSETRKRLANPRPARLAFQLEARLGHLTVLSNSSRHTEHQTIRYAPVEGQQARLTLSVDVFMADVSGDNEHTMAKELIVSVNGREKKIAIIENEKVTEFYIERGEGNQGIVGNIYKGRVMRVLPGMQSAFVDIGLERDAFLYVSDFFDEEEEFERIVIDKSQKGDVEDAQRAGGGADCAGARRTRTPHRSDAGTRRAASRNGAGRPGKR